MTVDHEPTQRSLLLGVLLKKLMSDAGVRQTEMATRLRWSHGAVSRILTGKRGGHTWKVRQWLDQFPDTSDAMRSKIEKLATGCPTCGCCNVDCYVPPEKRESTSRRPARRTQVKGRAAEVLQLFLDTPNTWFFARQITDRTGIFPQQLYAVLAEFVQQGWLYRRKVDNPEPGRRPYVYHMLNPANAQAARDACGVLSIDGS